MDLWDMLKKCLRRRIILVLYRQQNSSTSGILVYTALSNVIKCCCVSPLELWVVYNECCDMWSPASLLNLNVEWNLLLLITLQILSLIYIFNKSFLYKIYLSAEYRKLRNLWRALDLRLRLLLKTMLLIHPNKQNFLENCPFSLVVSFSNGKTSLF